MALNFNDIGQGLVSGLGDALSTAVGVIDKALPLILDNKYVITSLDSPYLPLLFCDSVKSLNFKQTTSVNNAPVENGTFMSYDKVSDPYTVDIMLIKSSGGTAEKVAFLAQIELMASSLNRYAIVTPDTVYWGVNIVGYDYAKENNNGATCIKVILHCQEVRIAKTSIISSIAEEATKNAESGSTSIWNASINWIDESVNSIFSSKIKGEI